MKNVHEESGQIFTLSFKQSQSKNKLSSFDLKNGQKIHFQSQ